MCGILAYYSNTLNIQLNVFIKNLLKLHHRGQDSVGISYLQTNELHHIRCKTFDELTEKT